MRRSKRKHSSTLDTSAYSKHGTRDTDEESESDDQEYEVEKISTRINHVRVFFKVDARLNSHYQVAGQREWEVKWMGYARTSWLRLEDLKCVNLNVDDDISDKIV